jgi:hypothetical protein
MDISYLTGFLSAPGSTPIADEAKERLGFETLTTNRVGITGKPHLMPYRLAKGSVGYRIC